MKDEWGSDATDGATVTPDRVAKACVMPTGLARSGLKNRGINACIRPRSAGTIQLTLAEFFGLGLIP